jgi:hypothetical protein
MSDMLTDIRFWAQIMDDARRTVLCSPDLESRIKGIVDSYGAGGFITVLASPYVPDDKVYIVNEAGIRAAWRP